MSTNTENVITKDESFQDRAAEWAVECFGKERLQDPDVRNFHFLEEAGELVQANGMTREDAHRVIDYVFDRPSGELKQEVGGVMGTLAAFCIAKGINMHVCAEVELERVWGCIDLIREKQKLKLK